jgi:hypothetical protein
MSAPTSTPASLASAALRSAWAHAIGSLVLLASVVAAAWFVSLPAFGADTFTRVAVTVVAGLYTLAAAVVVLLGDRGVVSVGVSLVTAVAVALVTDRFGVALGVVGAAIVMVVFVSRLDLARAGAEEGVKL